MLDKLLHNKEGQIIIEAIVAITIAVVGLLGIFSFLSQSLSLNKVVSDQYTGSYLAAEGLELVKNLVDAQANWGDLNVCDELSPCQMDYNDLTLGSGSNILHFDGTHYYYGGLPDDQTKFSRKIFLTYPQADEIKAVSRVEWTGRGGGSFKVELEDHFFNWK